MRADVEMQQLEAVRQILRFQQLRRRHQFDRAQPELGVFPAAFRPFPGAFAEQPGTDADVRFDPELAGDLDDLLQFLEFLDHHDHIAAQLFSHEGHPDET